MRYFSRLPLKELLNDVIRCIVSNILLYKAMPDYFSETDDSNIHTGGDSLDRVLNWGAVILTIGVVVNAFCSYESTRQHFAMAAEHRAAPQLPPLTAVNVYSDTIRMGIAFSFIKILFVGRYRWVGGSALLAALSLTEGITEVIILKIKSSEANELKCTEVYRGCRAATLIGSGAALITASRKIAVYGHSGFFQVSLANVILTTGSLMSSLVLCTRPPRF